MISFPWAVDAFFGGLKTANVTFFLPESLRVEDTQGGEVVTAKIGQRLWQGSVQLVSGYHAEKAADEARLSLIRESGRPFFAFPKHKAFPAYDPTGQILGSNLPLIHEVPSARELRLSGLPSSYQISAGDFLSFDYGASPVRTALHQVVETVAASGAGVTPAFEVTPPIRPGAAVGASVRLVRPYCRALYVPGSYSPGSSGPLISSGPAFRFRQTLR